MRRFLITGVLVVVCLRAQSQNNATSGTDVTGYSQVAVENQSITIAGRADVAFGANGSFRFLYNVTGAIVFDVATFGDPLPGVAKFGYMKQRDTNVQKPDGAKKKQSTTDNLQNMLLTAIASTAQETIQEKTGNNQNVNAALVGLLASVGQQQSTQQLLTTLATEQAQLLVGQYGNDNANALLNGLVSTNGLQQVQFIEHLIVTTGKENAQKMVGKLLGGVGDQQFQTALTLINQGNQQNNGNQQQVSSTQLNTPVEENNSNQVSNVQPMNTAVQSANLESTQTAFRLTTVWQGEGKSLGFDVGTGLPMLVPTQESASQYWKMVPSPDGYYWLTNVQFPDKSLEIIYGGNNNRLALATTGNFSRQLWKFSNNGDGTFRLTTLWQGEGNSLDILNDGQYNRELIITPSANYSGQSWKMAPLSIAATPVTPANTSFFTNGLVGSYYDNMQAIYQGGLPAVELNQSAIDFDWGISAPHQNIPPDNFLVRWVGTVVVPTTGEYTFYAVADDGVEVRINGSPLISAWVDQAPTEYQQPVYLNAGQSNTFLVYYYERGGGALIRVYISGPGIPKQILR